jgi:hypothetical protein
VSDDGEIHRGHIAARRNLLDELIECIAGGVSGSATLSAEQCVAALRVLEEVRDGHDARDFFEIRHKPGQRSRFAARDRFIALYFLRLSIDQPALDKQHLPTVAAEMGWDGAAGIKRVGRIVSEHRARMLPIAVTMTSPQVLSLLQVLTANPSVP